MADGPDASGLITRRAVKGDAPSEAVYSPCLRYRYSLRRVWAEALPRLTFVMLNPSTATEAQNDPTVERCERRARALGAGGFTVVNIFAWRDTDPKAMRASADPVGPENDAAIAAACAWADQVIAAWGTHGAHLGRGAEVLELLRDSGRPVAHFGLTAAGAPRHPLYVAYSQQPTAWFGPTGTNMPTPVVGN